MLKKYSAQDQAALMEHYAIVKEAVEEILTPPEDAATKARNRKLAVIRRAACNGVMLRIGELSVKELEGFEAPTDPGKKR